MRIFPFAINGSGEKFLFDFRGGETCPKILFLNREDVILESDLSAEELEEKTKDEWQSEALVDISDNFEEFLNLIKPRMGAITN